MTEETETHSRTSIPYIGGNGDCFQTLAEFLFLLPIRAN